MNRLYLKVGIGVSAFLTYCVLLYIEMSSGKPLPADAKTLMVGSFGLMTGLIGHLMTKTNSEPSTETKKETTNV